MTDLDLVKESIKEWELDKEVYEALKRLRKNEDYNILINHVSKEQPKRLFKTLMDFNIKDTKDDIINAIDSIKTFTSLVVEDGRFDLNGLNAIDHLSKKDEYLDNVTKTMV